MRQALIPREVKRLTHDLSWQAWCWRAGDLSQIQLPGGLARSVMGLVGSINSELLRAFFKPKDKDV